MTKRSVRISGPIDRKISSGSFGRALKRFPSSTKSRGHVFRAESNAPPAPRGTKGTIVSEKKRVASRAHFHLFGMLLVVIFIFLCSPVFAVQPPAASTPVRNLTADVALGADGLLMGRIVDTQGRPQAGQEVRIVSFEGATQTVRSDGNGQFAVRVRPGLFQVSTGGQTMLARFWRQGMQPPIAQPVLVLTVARPLVRGQDPPADAPWSEVLHGPFSLVTGGLLIGGMIEILDHNPPGS